MKAADLVARVCGGTTEVESHTIVRVLDTQWGDFRIEVDSLPLQERRYLAPLERFGLTVGSPTAEAIERSVLGMAQWFVPVEIVAPPVPLADLPRLDPLWTALREAGAEGSDDSPLHAFGLQLNPELPQLCPEIAFRHLQAYLLLEHELLERTGLDPSRRLTPFVRPFPASYVREALAMDPPTSWEALISHYLQANPTRNRPLDLLPLFRHVSEQGQASLEWLDGLEDEPALIHARPTFHYRLPDCQIGHRDWSPAEAWNGWVEVEQLAADDERLRQRRAAAVSSGRPNWLDQVVRVVAPGMELA